MQILFTKIFMTRVHNKNTAGNTSLNPSCPPCGLAGGTGCTNGPGRQIFMKGYWSRETADGEQKKMPS